MPPESGFSYVVQDAREWADIMEKQDERAQAYVDQVFPSILDDLDLVTDALGIVYQGAFTRRDPKDWTPGHQSIVATEDEARKILANVRDFPAFMDFVSYALGMGASTAAYPTLHDVHWAFGKAEVRTREDGRKILDYGLWEPVLEDVHDGSAVSLMKDLFGSLKGVENYTHGNYRIEWYPWRSRTVKAILREIRAGGDEPRIADFDREFESIWKALLRRFWTLMDDDADAISIDGRMDFKRSWKTARSNDPALFEKARLEMVEAVVRDRRKARSG